MSSGALIPNLLSIAASVSQAILISESSQNQVSLKGISTGPWKPPQWSQPALTILTVPATSNTSTGAASSSSTNYVFDAVFRVAHQRSIKKTQHPVLTGANSSDHAYVEPAKITLEIGMSDAMSSFSAGVWVGASTKSISAWQVIKTLELARTLFTVTTRLDIYYNMMILRTYAPDDSKSLHGLRCTIEMEELLAASVSSSNSSNSTSTSARPDATGSTPLGTVQSTTPNPASINSNVIPSTSYPGVNPLTQVHGAGNASSNSLGQLNYLP
jgi:hypothetical protein